MLDPQKVRPPHVLFTLLVITIGVQLWFKPARLILPPFHWLGLMFGTDGLFLMIWARTIFKKQETPVRHSEVPTKFVTEGPYRVTRNPMYVGAITLLCGMAVFVGTWPFMLLPLFLFLILDRIYIPWEEETMLRLFGEEYQKYLEETRRWL